MSVMAIGRVVLVKPGDNAGQAAEAPAIVVGIDNAPAIDVVAYGFQWEGNSKGFRGIRPASHPDADPAVATWRWPTVR